MTYCAMNGVELKIPMRASRPREPARPLPALTMKSPLVAQRMQRPRTKAERSLAGVDVKECLAIIKQCRAQQRDYELKLKSLVEELAKLVAGNGSLSDRRTLQAQIDNMIECIKKLAARANEAALAAIKGGASQEDVRAAGLDNLEVKAPVNAAPVVETNSPTLLTDGSVLPGPDAKAVDLETGKPVPPKTEVEKAADGDSAGMHPLLLIALAGGAVWLLSRG